MKAQTSAPASPRVSFLITVFNGADHIENTVRHLLQVDWLDTEIVVINDGSTDDTGEICGRLAAVHDCVKYVTLPRVGRAKALNYGVAKATGEVIAVNDADDISLPRRPRAAMEIFESRPNVVLVAGGYRIVNSDNWARDVPGLLAGSFTAQGFSSLSARALYRGNTLVHSGVTFRKSAWSAAGGYNEDLDSCIDYEFYFRLLAVGDGVTLNEVNILYRKDTQSYFKKMNPGRYLRSMWAAQQTARRRCRIPFYMRVYDLQPLARATMSALSR